MWGKDKLVYFKKSLIKFYNLHNFCGVGVNVFIYFVFNSSFYHVYYKNNKLFWPFIMILFCSGAITFYVYNFQNNANAVGVNICSRVCQGVVNLNPGFTNRIHQATQNTMLYWLYYGQFLGLVRWWQNATLKDVFTIYTNVIYNANKSLSTWKWTKLLMFGPIR